MVYPFLNLGTFNQPFQAIGLNQVTMYTSANFGSFDQPSVIKFNKVTMYTTANFGSFNQPQVVKLIQVTVYTSINSNTFSQPKVIKLNQVGLFKLNIEYDNFSYFNSRNYCPTCSLNLVIAK